MNSTRCGKIISQWRNMYFNVEIDFFICYNIKIVI